MKKRKSNNTSASKKRRITKAVKAGNTNKLVKEVKELETLVAFNNEEPFI